MGNCFRWLILALCVFAVSSCGKYGKPLPPQDFAPAEVDKLAVTTSVQGVTFDWVAPQKDSRGKKLKDLEGYRIYRRELEKTARLIDPEAKFELIGTIEDTHLKELLDLKEKALTAGQISRKVTLPEERSKFQFIDRSAVPDKRYYYQIVAFNQGGVEGKVIERVNILFRGEISEIARIPFSAEEFEF